MTQPGTSRRLATILAADVVGYSRLMAQDEEATVRTLKAHRVIIDRLIARHEGRIFNTAGDSVLAEFGSVVEAVRCATTIQDELRVRNAELVESRQMLFRIGVNIGDVIADGDDLLGDGINVAARLESIAPPGGICISGGTFEQVKNKLSIGFEDLGPQTVKNIPDPVAAFRITGAPVSVSTAEGDPESPTPTGTATGKYLVGAVLIAVIAVAAWKLLPRTSAPPARVQVAPEQTSTRVPLPNPVSPAVERPADKTSTSPVAASAPSPEPVAPSEPERLLTTDLPSKGIAELMTGVTIEGIRKKDSQPFTIELYEGGLAYYSFPRTGAGAGTTFRATGSWRTEDGLFCMRIRGFNQHEESCPQISLEGSQWSARRPNGQPLDWTVSRSGAKQVTPSSRKLPESTDEMVADEIRTMISGLTIHGTRQRDGRSFTIALKPGGAADFTLQRPDKAPFRETGKWWSEDYRFCMRFSTFNNSQEMCPRVVRDGKRLAMTKSDGSSLSWTLKR